MSALTDEMTNPDYIDRFLQSARDNPDATAIKAGKAEVSYRELETLVRRYAACFRETNGGRILIALPPGVDVYAAILGSGLAGCTHTPLNLASPPEKAERIIGMLQPDVIVGEDPAGQLQQTRPEARHLRPSQLPDVVYAGEPGWADTAYILFTSGSTGLPKGVVVPRKALNHYVGWIERDIAPVPGDRIAQHANLAFDISMTDIFGALCFGATLVPLMSEGDRMLAARMIFREKITVWNSTPSVMSLIIQAGEDRADLLGSVRLFNFCGEALLPSQVEPIFRACPSVTVHNTYGPTEATIAVTNQRLSAEDWQDRTERSVTIGPPIAGMDLHLVGGSHADEGEIVITGPQLADGYLDNPEKTGAQFRDVATPDGVKRGYYTGDWAERRDGMIFFKERIDFQVKIRGHRIEMDEVATAMRKAGWPMVVIFPQDDFQALCAVVEKVEGQDFNEKAVRASLAGKIEPYAIPQRVRMIDRLPRNENDKVDRRAAIAWFHQQHESIKA